MSSDAPLIGVALTDAISAAILGLYRDFYGHDRATASTYLNDSTVVCVLEDILTRDDTRLVEFGDSDGVVDGLIAFQTATEDEFTTTIEGLTRRRVVAFLSANQANPGVACELFLLEKDHPAEDRPWDRP